MAFLPNLSGVDSKSALAKLVAFFGQDVPQGIQRSWEMTNQPPPMRYMPQSIQPPIYPGPTKLVQPIGDVINAQSRFRGIRTNPYTEMGEPTVGGGKGYTPGATTPQAGQTSFGESDFGLRGILEQGRFGKNLTDFERSQMPKPGWEQKSNQEVMDAIKKYDPTGSPYYDMRAWHELTQQDKYDRAQWYQRNPNDPATIEWQKYNK